MALRVGPGPVFVYESLILARRRQVYAGRALFVLVMFIGLATAWWNTGRRIVRDTGPGTAATVPGSRAAGERFFYAWPASSSRWCCWRRRRRRPGPSATTARGIFAAARHDGPLRRRDRAGQAGLAAGSDPGTCWSAGCR